MGCWMGLGVAGIVFNSDPFLVSDYPEDLWCQKLSNLRKLLTKPGIFRDLVIVIEGKRLSGYVVLLMLFHASSLSDLNMQNGCN